jgi:pimeloyl-ACP methyl ester carboxylesterase
VIQRRNVELINGKFSYLEVGSGEPVVLLHALGRGASDWSYVMEALGVKWHCFAIDFRGHGESVHTATYSFDEFVLDIGRFVDVLGLESFYLIGHSMGGNVGWRFAARRPDKVRKMVIEDVAPPRGRDRYLTPPAVPPEQVDYDWVCRLRILEELNNPDPDWWPDLKQVVCPVLVLSGGDDAEQKDAADLVRNGRHVVWNGAGHWIHETRPNNYIEAVVNFLEG